MSELVQLAQKVLNKEVEFFELKDFDERQKFIELLKSELDKMGVDYRKEVRFFSELGVKGIIVHFITTFEVPAKQLTVKIYDTEVTVH